MTPAAPIHAAMFKTLSRVLVSAALGMALIHTPDATAKSFFEYCRAPESVAQENTVLAVMVKMRILDQRNDDNCRTTEALLQQRPFLNIWPDPFDPPRGPASDLKPLEEQTHLRNLSIAGNEITDITPLGNLAELTQINLSFNPISDISPLKQLTRLREVIAAKTKISDLTSLQSLTALESISFEYAAIQDLSPLARLPRLSIAYLGGNDIKQTSALTGRQWRYLSLENNKITQLDIKASQDSLIMLDASRNKIATTDSIQGLQRLTKVDAINLSDNNLSAVNQLRELTTLRWLNISGNQIESIDSLGSLTNLEHLLLAGNQICQLPESVLALTKEHLNSRGQWIKLKINGQDEQRDCRHAL
jgi:Leucine-rich repeat (LRR) protein